MIKALKICLVSPLPLPKGGISHWTEMITNYSQSQGIEVLNVDTAVRWRGVDELTKWKRVVGGGIQLLRDIFKFFLILVVDKPNVVHLTTSGQFGVIRDIVILSFCRIFRIYSVYHIRFGRIPEISKLKTTEWRLIKISMRLSKSIIVIDNKTEIAVKENYSSLKLKNIPNCFLETKKKKPIKNKKGDINVCFIGWVIPSKGIEELLLAWQKSKKQNICLHIVGPCRPEYQYCLMQKFKPENTIFHGFLEHSDAMDILAASDVFVLPSHTEGFPNVVLEAMAYGKAIIATNVGAIPDMLSKCGIVINPFCVEELSIELDKLINNKNLRLTLGQNAKQKAYEKYSIRNVFIQYLNVWKQSNDKKVI